MDHQCSTHADNHWKFHAMVIVGLLTVLNSQDNTGLGIVIALLSMDAHKVAYQGFIKCENAHAARCARNN